MRTEQFKNFGLLKTSMTGVETYGLEGVLYNDLVIENSKTDNHSFVDFNEKFGLVHGDFSHEGSRFTSLFVANEEIKFEIDEQYLKLKSFSLTNGHDVIVIFEDEEENNFFYYFTDLEETLREQYNEMI